MSFRRYYRTISELSKKAMMTNTQRGTVNTGASTSRRQSNVSLNVDAPVFTVPKLLRPYFKYDRNLFEEVSKIIFSIIRDFYNGIGKTTIKTGIIVSY